MTADIAERIQHEVRRLPEPLAFEVLDFIGYLNYRHGLMELDRDKKALQAISVFRGSGRGGGSMRLLADRHTDLERET